MAARRTRSLHQLPEASRRGAAANEQAIEFRKSSTSTQGSSSTDAPGAKNGENVERHEREKGSSGSESSTAGGSSSSASSTKNGTAGQSKSLSPFCHQAYLFPVPDKHQNGEQRLAENGEKSAWAPVAAQRSKKRVEFS